MNVVFYISAAVAVISTALAITRLNAVHALLYLILSLLSLALVFFSLGAPFVAALEVIVYAGAIMVLFLFVIMLLNLGQQAEAQERSWLPPGAWTVPALLGAVLAAEVVFIVFGGAGVPTGASAVDPKGIGMSLFGPYLVGVELAALLLLAGMVGAYHLGRKEDTEGAGEES